MVQQTFSKENIGLDDLFLNNTLWQLINFKLEWETPQTSNSIWKGQLKSIFEQNETFCHHCSPTQAQLKAMHGHFLAIQRVPLFSWAYAHCYILYRFLLFLNKYSSKLPVTVSVQTNLTLMFVSAMYKKQVVHQLSPSTWSMM